MRPKICAKDFFEKKISKSTLFNMHITMFKIISSNFKRKLVKGLEFQELHCSQIFHFVSNIKFLDDKRQTESRWYSSAQHTIF